MEIAGSNEQYSKKVPEDKQLQNASQILLGHSNSQSNSATTFESLVIELLKNEKKNLRQLKREENCTEAEIITISEHLMKKKLEEENKTL